MFGYHLERYTQEYRQKLADAAKAGEKIAGGNSLAKARDFLS